MGSEAEALSLDSSEEVCVDSEVECEEKLSHLIKSFTDHCRVSEGEKECRTSTDLGSNLYEKYDNQDVEGQLFPENSSQNASFGLDANTSFGIDCRHNADYQVTSPGKVTFLEEENDFALMEPFCNSVSEYDTVETFANGFSSTYSAYSEIRSPSDTMSPTKEKNITVISLCSSDDEEFQSEGGLYIVDLCNPPTNNSP
jgi:hypothetical protein